MSRTLERPTAPPKTQPRSSRWAWLALLSSVVLQPLAIGVALSQQDTAWGGVAFVAFTLLPPVAAILLGIRSGRTGNRLGGLASAFGSAWLTFIIVFYLGANYVWSGDSLVAPTVAAITTAVLVGGAVEAGWYRWFRRTGRHPA